MTISSFRRAGPADSHAGARACPKAEQVDRWWQSLPAQVQDVLSQCPGGDIRPDLLEADIDLNQAEEIRRFIFFNIANPPYARRLRSVWI